MNLRLKLKAEELGQTQPSSELHVASLIFQAGASCRMYGLVRLCSSHLDPFHHVCCSNSQLVELLGVAGHFKTTIRYSCCHNEVDKITLALFIYSSAFCKR